MEKDRVVPYEWASGRHPPRTNNSSLNYEWAKIQLMDFIQSLANTEFGAKPLLEKNQVKELVDPRLEDQYDMVQLKRVMYTASTCLHHLPNMQPNMKRVVHLVKGENELLDVKQKSMGGRALILDVCDLDDYSSTTYLKDLDRHMELVLE